jgi:ATP-dependent DNA helicase RecG
MEGYFAQDDEVVVYGKAKSLKPRTMDHPETEVIEGGEEMFIHVNRITPIYPLTEGLPQRWLRGLIWRTLPRHIVEFDAAETSKPFGGLPSRGQALQWLHFPDDEGQAEMARRRLAFDEFRDLQMELGRRRQKLQQNARALPCGGDNSVIRPFLKQLGFELTEAQKRVLRELRHDLGGAWPMRRLLQGDVGAGKTVVAACAALMTIESGFAVAVMAPTEILANQHFQNFTRWFEPLGIPVELQTGSIKTGPTAREGKPPLVIGTHALIESGFNVEKLGLVAIDEQHKFGVTQREKLVRKGRYPHLLVMTATPIPRTLGLTVYGDLDISTIDELPRNRTPVRTFVRSAEALPKVFTFLRSQLKLGRQAFVVYPRVEEGEEGESKAATKEFERIERGLRPYRVGLLHGQMRAREKNLVSEQFGRNEIQVLVATSIIEVGVDVPNATVMLIENAEQFGLAQLHQMRGRVGRSAHQSYCILVATARSREARHRLSVLEASSDGFAIAEADLRLRGPGEFLGSEQSGAPSFRFGDLAEDIELIKVARESAKKALADESEA